MFICYWQVYMGTEAGAGVARQEFNTCVSYLTEWLDANSAFIQTPVNATLVDVTEHIRRLEVQAVVFLSRTQCFLKSLHDNCCLLDKCCLQYSELFKQLLYCV